MSDEFEVLTEVWPYHGVPQENASYRPLLEHVTIQHVLAAVQELYGVEALDKVTGRAIERAGYTLPGSAPVLPLARAQWEPVVVPQGWKLVPVEPTLEMMEAADIARPLPGCFIAEVWATMLSAAPATLEAEEASRS